LENKISRFINYLITLSKITQCSSCFVFQYLAGLRTREKNPHSAFNQDRDYETAGRFIGLSGGRPRRTSATLRAQSEARLLAAFDRATATSPARQRATPSKK
jgi:hypothetical protein